jgi:hypothetical protein
MTDTFTQFACEIGDQPVATATFRNVLTGELESPAVVVCTVTRPTGAEFALSTVEVSVGVFRAVLPPLDQRGPWWVEMAGTQGLVTTVREYFMCSS